MSPICEMCVCAPDAATVIECECAAFAAAEIGCVCAPAALIVIVECECAPAGLLAKVEFAALAAAAKPFVKGLKLVIEWICPPAEPAVAVAWLWFAWVSVVPVC